MRFKGIIFDLDGTLIDSMSVWEKVDREFLTENGIVPPGDISDIVKTMTPSASSEYFIKRFGLKLSVDFVLNRIEQLVKEEYEKNIPLKEGAREFLEICRQKEIKMSVATATYPSLAKAAIKRLGIDEYMQFVLTCDEAGAGKSESPAVYDLAAEKMGLKSDEIIIVEDALHCVKTAKQAGYYVAAVYDSTSAFQEEKIRASCDIFVKKLTEIEIDG